MGHRRTGARPLAVVALLVSAAACTSGTGATAPAKNNPSAPAPTRSSHGISAPAGSSAAGSSVSTPTRPCLRGPVTVLYPPADNPLRTACLHVGTVIHVTLKPSANYSWAPVSSSNPNTVTMLDDHTTLDGTRSATARAAASGTATLTSAGTYTPDPHGPPSRAWRLTLTVVP